MLMASITRVLNPYRMTPPAERAGYIDVSEAESKVAFLPVKRILLECEWFRLYDVIEDVFDQLNFYEIELAPEDETPRSPYLRRDLNVVPRTCRNRLEIGRESHRVARIRIVRIRDGWDRRST